MAATTTSSASTSEEFIRYDLFLIAIAKCLHPDPLDSPNFDGVVGKHAHSVDLGLSSVTQPISKTEKALLQRFLNKHPSKLQKINARMSESEIQRFYESYRKIPGRPEFEPSIYSLDDQISLRDKRAEARYGHEAQMKEAIKKGRMRIFDNNRLPQPALQSTVYSFIPKEDAEAYLKERLMDLQQVLGGSGTKESTRAPRQAWTPEFSRLAEVDAAVLGYPKAAEKHGMSRSQLAKSVQRWKEKLSPATSAPRSNSPTKQKAIWEDLLPK